MRRCEREIRTWNPGW